MSNIITEEWINDTNEFLKCDSPIWKEFALGLELRGSYARNNNFRGVRGLWLAVPNTQIRKHVYIVTHNKREQSFFHDVVKASMIRDHEDLKIEKFDRLDKEVYAMEYANDYGNS